MGPLVLLQGISGTGKTSLPLAFARAMGTRATVVEVQAGWRDPQDLLGHYNAFEKRFYERECLQALYRAQTPRWADTVQIILLDEMNLSHPEQYFSDMLSVLERNPEERHLVLMPHALEGAPALFREGHKLRITENVWFVGTANHDETTKDFADKTYDRAHVMELPLRPQPFQIQPLLPRPPVSFRALRKAFDDAIERHKREADRVIEFLEKHIRDPMMRYFAIGWGPRLERQLRRYVPVVIAAGGTVGEAADHMLAMRLLRKLKHRHDNRPQDLDALRRKLESAWRDLDTQREPRRSMEVLHSELRRLGWAPEDRA
ncbi:MAG: AAA family ATPase [Myxococcota bacterium]|nr:AAA family ATPase [Myxococcota bacterium]